MRNDSQRALLSECMTAVEKTGTHVVVPFSVLRGLHTRMKGSYLVSFTLHSDCGLSRFEFGIALECSQALTPFEQNVLGYAPPDTQDNHEHINAMIASQRLAGRMVLDPFQLYSMYVRNSNLAARVSDLADAGICVALTRCAMCSAMCVSKTCSACRV
jgi:hypothetical protein